LEEETLTGGHVSRVVRVGDTVRRSAGGWTPTIHRLLASVRAQGLRWVPEPLGFDELGREVLSFIPGEVPHDMPAWSWSELALCDVARALRQWHDATAGFARDDAIWNLPAHTPHEVVCHNDFAPYNCVFREGRLVGVIDFDFCSPGPRLWDIAYTAYRFVPLMPPRDAEVGDAHGERSPFSPSQQRARLELFLEVYAAAGPALRYERAAVLAMTSERLTAIAAWTAEHVRATGATALRNHATMYLAHARWLRGVV
jgi:Ser/Thr protein kinase RdoA (MazF antagonist)